MQCGKESTIPVSRVRKAARVAGACDSHQRVLRMQTRNLKIPINWDR